MEEKVDTGMVADGSGYISNTHLKNSITIKSIHTGDGECKITLLSE